MKKILHLILILPLAFAFASCGSDEPGEGGKTESVKAADKLSGVWVYEKYSSPNSLYNQTTYTITSFGREKEITNVDGVPMTFVGTLNVKDVYPSWQTFNFDYYIQIDPALSTIKAWSKSTDGQHWSVTLFKEYRYKFNQDGTLSLTGEYGTEVCKRQ